MCQPATTLPNSKSACFFVKSKPGRISIDRRSSCRHDNRKSNRHRHHGRRRRESGQHMGTCPAWLNHSPAEAKLVDGVLKVKVPAPGMSVVRCHVARALMTAASGVRGHSRMAHSSLLRVVVEVSSAQEPFKLTTNVAVATVNVHRAYRSPRRREATLAPLY